MTDYHNEDGDWEPVNVDWQVVAALLLLLGAIVTASLIAFGAERCLTVIMWLSIFCALISGALMAVLLLFGNETAAKVFMAVAAIWLIIWLAMERVLRFV